MLLSSGRACAIPSSICKVVVADRQIIELMAVSLCSFNAKMIKNAVICMRGFCPEGLQIVTRWWLSFVQPGQARFPSQAAQDSSPTPSSSPPQCA
jgi:hypothetical protein